MIASTSTETESLVFIIITDLYNSPKLSIFLEEDFWTPSQPPPLLSILYMDLKC